MKSTDLRPIEQAKIKCAKKLFNEISTDDVVFDKVDSYQNLLDIYGECITITGGNGENFMDNSDHSQPILNQNIIASAHINFLFGAGVNGKAFQQLDEFDKTKNKIKELGGTIEKGIESGIDEIEDEGKRSEIKETFIEEFKEFYKEAITENTWNESTSLINLRLLLAKTYSIVHETQNRNPSMKQINIFTLNYDDIVERSLSYLGHFYNAISASNTATKAAMMNVIGYDYTSKKFIPSFMVSKLHGDIDKPIIPGKTKYRDMLNEDYFEIAFNMKSQLCRMNSILIVIGYSGKDNHINKILQDCINSGLTLYWYKYKENDEVPFKDSQVIIRDQDDYKNNQDTTKNCYEDLKKAWAEKSEE